MKKILITALIVISLGLGVLHAQEITGFRAQFANKRYEISFSLPGGSSTSKYDLYIFAREQGQDAWFKAVTILGDFQHLPAYHSGLVYWDPFFDMRKEGSYDFKLYAVPSLYARRDYSYSRTYQIGTLRIFSDQKDAVYRVSGKDLLSTDVIALPVGDYEVNMVQKGKVTETRGVSVLPFRLTEVDLSPRYGNLRLSSTHSGALYAVGDGTPSPQTSYQLKAGKYSVKISVPQSNAAYPPLSSKLDVVVEAESDTYYHFDLPYGTLDLSSDLSLVRYQVLGKDLQSVKGLMLNPGTVEVKAISSQNPAGVEQTLSMRLSVLAGQTTSYSFEFRSTWGSLSVRTPNPASFITLNGLKVSNLDDLKLPGGTYDLTAVMDDGSFYGPARIKIEPGQTTVHRFEGRPNPASQWKHARHYRFTDGLRWPLSDLAIINISSPANEFPDPDDNSSIANPNTANRDMAQGISTVGLLDLKVFSHRGALHYFYSVGLLDRLYLLRDQRSAKTSFATDLLSVGAGIGVKAFWERLYLELSAKGSATSQTPLYRYLTLEDDAWQPIKYRYVESFVESDGEGDDVKRKTTTTSWGAAAQVTGRLQFRITRLINVYGMAAFRAQNKEKGKWYKNEDVSNWLTDSSVPKPAPVSGEVRFPNRNTVMGGDSFHFGIGISLSAW